ncbi:major facilitator superfamily domain-containing protein [Triangularia verruculosa]|uniref:Major facilitator superfamily domain-containing protein n=1 Tax=Triangularia verruculosa TaxID=2587418 RepID=A0AAN7AV09_9PEZI|nr:major facilitator superfamily domain-containing protein [Triangularia verruculosa]
MADQLKTESVQDAAIVNSSASSTSPAPDHSNEVDTRALEWKPSMATRLAFSSLCVLALMAALDGTSIGVALPAIANALKGSAIETFWSGTSFLLSSTVLQPTFVSLSDIFGRRNVLLFSIAFFFAGALICCLAQNFTTMLVGRSVQGSGAGGVFALTEVVIADLVPLRHRGEYYGGMNAMWAIGSVLGPIVGGGFAGNQNAGWRWIFYINFPFIVVGTVLVLFYMRLRFKAEGLAQQLRAVDWVGSVLFIGSTTAFLLGLTWGGVIYPWGSYQTLVPLLLGAAGCVGFAVYEAYVAKQPLIPLVLFRGRTTVVCFFGTVITGLVLWCILYYLPLYFQAVKGYSPVISGVALFPQTFTVAPAGALAGGLITKFGKYRWSIWLGWGLGTVGLGLFCVLDVNTSIPGWIFLNLVSGLGLGFLFPAIATAIQASVASEHVTIAIAMFSFFRSAGQALGVAVGGVIFQNRMYANLLTYENLAGRAALLSADAVGLVEVIHTMPDGAEKDNLRQAYADSLRIVWAVCCALAGVAFIVSLWTKHHDLNQALDTKQGIVEGKKGGVGGSGGDAVSDPVEKSA